MAAFVVVAAFYAGSFSFREITDTRLNSLQTRALVLHGDVDLTRYGDRAPPKAFVRHHAGHVFAIYSVGLALPAAPFYLVLAHLTSSEAVLQGTVAVAFSAAAVIALWWLLLDLFDRRLATAAAATFAFGTTLWPLSSTAFYPHSEVALFQILGMRALLSTHRRAPIFAGLAFGYATFARPSMILFAGAAGVFYVIRGWRPTASFVAGSIVPLAGVLIANRWIWGNWLTSGYSALGVGFHGEIPQNLRELLFGWWRGLFVYSPVLIIGLLGLIAAAANLRSSRAERRTETVFVVLGIASLGAMLFYARFTTWWAGTAQFGYRYLLEATPPLIVLAAYLTARSERARPATALLAIVSIITMAFGAVPYKWGFDFTSFPRTFVASPIGQAWIVGIHHPAPALTRLAGVAAVTVCLGVLGRLARSLLAEGTMLAPPA